MSRQFGAGKIFLTIGTGKTEHKQEYEVELLFSQGSNLGFPGINPTLQVDSLSAEPPGKPFFHTSYTKLTQNGLYS